MNNGLVYSYRRFSDPKQAAGDSSQRQWAYAAKWAADHGRQLDETLSMEDKGLSAYHQHHVKKGALGVFLAAVEAGRVEPGSVLVVEGLDRLSRAEPLIAQAQLAQIINSGISVVTASDNKVYSREALKANPMDLVYSLLVMIRAHEESETKSTRVKAAIRRQCEAWQAGTYRGVIRNGTDPSWVRWDKEAKRWELIEDRAAVVRQVLEWYQAGWGVTRIVREMLARKMSFTGRQPNQLGIHRLVRLQPLMGHREIEVDGETFLLRDYYPPLLAEADWPHLQAVADKRGIRWSRGDVPALFTGFGVARCGYCGSPMVAQTSHTRRRADGTLPDFARRIGCSKQLKMVDCNLGRHISVVPLEKAVLNYCSDIMNLRALQTGDRSAAPKARLAGALASLADVERRQERLMRALMASDDPPAMFVKQARELELEKSSAAEAVRAAEREVADTVRVDFTDADQKWRDLAEGVLQLDEDARTKARQLVVDTFETITIWLRGVRPDETPEGCMDVVLKAKGGGVRVLRVATDGTWQANETVEVVA